MANTTNRGLTKATRYRDGIESVTTDMQGMLDCYGLDLVIKLARAMNKHKPPYNMRVRSKAEAEAFVAAEQAMDDVNEMVEV